MWFGPRSSRSGGRTPSGEAGDGRAKRITPAKSESVPAIPVSRSRFANVVTVGFIAASVKSRKHRIVAAVPRCSPNGADIHLEQVAGIDAAASALQLVGTCWTAVSRPA